MEKNNLHYIYVQSRCVVLSAFNERREAMVVLSKMFEYEIMNTV